MVEEQRFQRKARVYNLVAPTACLLWVALWEWQIAAMHEAPWERWKMASGETLRAPERRHVHRTVGPSQIPGRPVMILVCRLVPLPHD